MRVTLRDALRGDAVERPDGEVAAHCGGGHLLVGVEAQVQAEGLRGVEAVAGEAAPERPGVQPHEGRRRGRRQAEGIVPALVLRARQRALHRAHLQRGRRHGGVLGGRGEEEVLREGGVVGVRQPAPEHAAPHGVGRAAGLPQQGLQGLGQRAHRAARALDPHGVDAVRTRPERVPSEHLGVHE